MLLDLFNTHSTETLCCRDIALPRCLDDPSRTSIIVKTKQHYVSNCDLVENNYLSNVDNKILRWGHNNFEMGAK